MVLALMSPDGIWHNHLFNIFVCRRTRGGSEVRDAALSDVDESNDYLLL